MILRMPALLTVSALIVGFAAPVMAQPAASTPMSSRPGSGALIGGLSAGSGDSSGSIGVGLAFDATERVAVEGRGVFLQRGRGRAWTRDDRNKPYVRALVVFANGDQLALTTMTVGFGYRF